MALFPLKGPLSNDEVIRTTCKLYRLSMFKVLPLTISLLLLYNFIRYGAHLYPANVAHLHPQIAFFAIVIFLPLTGTLFLALDTIAKDAPLSFGKIMLTAFERFLAQAGCFLSMLLLPALIIGVCVGVYFFLGIKQVANPFLFAWLMFSGLILFAVFVPKLFAPILVFIDRLGANESIDESARILQGNFFRAFLFCLFAGLELIFFALLGHLLVAYFPALKTQSPLLVESVGQLLLVLVGSWSFALLLTLKYDLQQRNPANPTLTLPIAKARGF